MKRTVSFAFAVIISSFVASAAKAGTTYEPAGTYLYAQKDTCDLFLDIYNPTPGSVTSVDGHKKPSVLFLFGGGFFTGSRDDEFYLPWYRMLNDEGYRVIAIDYRLGLRGVKGVGMNVKFIKSLRRALDMAVEDLFSATAFLIENAFELGIDPDNIVISGSSAGAMTSLQAEWEICNGRNSAGVLPDSFNYAGVMAFSGAIFSNEGSIKYTGKKPCPQMLCHGTIDKIVPYGAIKAFNLCFAGTDQISKTLISNGYNYNIYRYLGHGHDIASAMIGIFDEEITFLETNVTCGVDRKVDATIDDERMPVPDWAKAGFASIYEN